MKKSRKNGFTLIEIMVATVIMVIMTGLVIQITSEVLKVWNRSTDKLSSNAQARIAMDLLTSDLESAVIRNNGLRWLESTQENVPSPLNSTSLQTTRLFLFSPALDRPQTDAGGDPIGGDVCAISYRLVYQDPVNGGDDEEDNIFALHRRLIDSKTTFEDLMGVGNQESFADWNGDTPVPSSVALPGGATAYPAPTHPSYFLASNVIDFRVDFYYEDGSGIIQKIPSPIRYGGDSPAATIGPGSSVKFPIAYAEITLRVLADEAMELLRQEAVDQSGLTKEDYVGANSEVYSRRIFFQSKPL